MLNYKIIASGSSGNAVLIDDVLVDCGVSFQKLKPYLKGVRYLIVTHIHTDHLNTKTYQRIRKLYPRICTIGNYEVGQLVDLDIIANSTYEVKTKDYNFIPIEVPHNALCYAYVWKAKTGDVVLYATDLNSTDPIRELLPDQKYDYFFLESNHDERKLEQIRNVSVKKYGYDAYAGAKRHLSTQQAKGFYYMYRRDKDSVWEELHKSSRFY